SLVVLAVTAAVGLGWAGGLGHGAYLSMDLMPLMALPLVLAAFVAWPLAQPVAGAPPGRWGGAALLLAGLGVPYWVRTAQRYDVRPPDTTYVIYQIDQDAGRAWRVSAAPTLNPWSRSVLGPGVTRLTNWVWSKPVDAAPAPMVQETPP